MHGQINILFTVHPWTPTTERLERVVLMHLTFWSASSSVHRHFSDAGIWHVEDFDANLMKHKESRLDKSLYGIFGLFLCL